MKTKSLVYCAIFTALIAIGAFIRIPVPPVAISLQTMFVALAALILGAKQGALCPLIYLITGLIGIPVFTSGGGISYLITPSAGFLIGFIPSAYITGILRKNSFKSAFVAVLSGNAVMYITALAYTYILTNFVTNQIIPFLTLFVSYCLIFIPTDILKSAAAAYIYIKLKKSGIR